MQKVHKTQEGGIQKVFSSWRRGIGGSKKHGQKWTVEGGPGDGGRGGGGHVNEQQGGG